MEIYFEKGEIMEKVLTDEIKRIIKSNNYTFVVIINTSINKSVKNFLMANMHSIKKTKCYTRIIGKILQVV